MIWLGEFHGSGTQGSNVCERTPFSVKIEVRVTLVDFLIIVAADLPAHIGRNVSVGQFGNERVTQRVEAECSELPAFPLFLHSAIGVTLRILHHMLKLR